MTDLPSGTPMDHDSDPILDAVASALDDATLPGPDAQLRARVLASRERGARVILPVGDRSPRRARWRWFAAMAAAIVLFILTDALWFSRKEVTAGATNGALTVSPAMPRAGATLTFTYTAPATLATSPRLLLRARIRSAHSDSYEGGASVVPLATLIRGRDGRYTATATLPDSVVFAALAVASEDGTTVDDHEKRTWEVLTTLDGRQPSLLALDQRAHDLMGRSFEEGHATAKRMVALYPDSLTARNWLRSFESWMGLAGVDSLAARHSAVIRRLDAAWRGGTPTGAEMGQLAWYARYGRDSVIGKYWQERVIREAPSNSYAVQWRTIAVLDVLHRQHDTTAALVALEAIWADRTPDRAAQVAGYALNLAVAGNRMSDVSRWMERAIASVRTPIGTTLSIAESFASSRSLADTAILRTRTLLGRVAAPHPIDGRLTETASDYAARVASLRARSLRVLGLGLITVGQTRAGFDTLTLAAASGWDLATIRSLRSAAFRLGDSTSGWRMTARWLSDPSVASVTRDSLTALAEAAVGRDGWRTFLISEQQVFAQRMLERSTTSRPAGTPMVRDSSGGRRRLAELAAGRITAVVFTSRACGWAIEDLPEMVRVAAEIERRGGRLIVIMEDEQGPSPELDAFLRERKVTVPVWFDVDHSTSKAFNNWGTPQYYLLDAQGRSRFEAVSTAGEALARVEALRIAGQ